jgi:hypothetical protein
MTVKEVLCRPFSIFTYDLSKIDNVTKVRFVYLLKGRKQGQGLVDESKGRFLVPGCFIIPTEVSSAIELIFKQWKVPYKKEEVLMH